MTLEASVKAVADAIIYFANTTVGYSPIRFTIGPMYERPINFVPIVTDAKRAKGPIMADLVMNAGQACPLHVEITDAQGHPAAFESPLWAVDNPTVMSIESSPDGRDSVITTNGPLGNDVLVSFQCDADLGGGVEPLAATLSVDVVSGAATTVKIIPGTPTDMAKAEQAAPSGGKSSTKSKG